jgi:hypothetical protein
MTTKEIQLEPGAPDHRKRHVDPSRRRFIQAAAAGAVAATVPLAGIAEMQQAETRTELEDPMEKALKRYGSELGNLKRIG